ncbi:FG-GAP-like repeat-containing protein [Streptomyces canus]|uniref:FG-GAP-like repeat-containing protein n=1 Tax=Streptomyces canus TaxID=58343 RepID=UPI00037758A1|nr:FG-GAP-like repeat-containing protein [Streptomyces canus]
MRVQRRGWRTALAVVLAVGGAVALPATAGAAAAPHQVRDDFNGDGYADLAVAAPDGTVAGRAKAGFVGVLYGSASGLKSSTKQVFSQNTAGVPGGSEAGDRFGSALTTADLDRDGYTDLIVGVGGEDRGSGRVQVVWGGARGLAGGATLASGAAGQGLGAQGHLAAADVDGDGATDLLTAVDRYGLVATGGPFTRSGSATGKRQVVKDRYDSRVLDLDVGDLNGDGITDVVAAQTGTDTFDSRRIAYWWGTKDGLTPWTLVWDIDGAALQGGENLAVGDVNRDGYADIVVGRAVDGYESDHDAYRAKGGRVTWIPGTSGAPDGVAEQAVNQDSPGVPGTAEKGDRFGTDVQLADVDGDGFLDVVTGVPGEDLGPATAPNSVKDAGAVVVLSGRADGLTGVGSHQVVTQDSPGVPGATEKGDAFGGAVHVGDANGDGLADVAVGAPGENAGAGSVWSFRSRGQYVVSPGGVPIPATILGPDGTFTFGHTLLGTTAAKARLGSEFAN